jgi:hypothetical protein
VVTRAPSIPLGGRYLLAERLAVGGMGEVWGAEDQVLGRAVAVKLLREEHACDPEFRRRFRAEAQHAAMLVHPNIAQVYDFGEGDETTGEPPYLVMELVRGEPLSVIIDRDGPLDAERTWAILGQAASALAAAHDAGIVHRDIKPANLLVCPDGRLKVTDFGIARATGASAVTTAGNMLGTPHYVSPEQVSGEPVTAASDFYALGVVAYECLTGRRLYDGEPMTVLLAHREQEPPPLPAGVPAGLRDLVTALLDKDPARRPVDGRAIAAQAERFNAPTIAMPIAAAPYPTETAAAGGSTDVPATAPAPTGLLPTPAAAGKRPRVALLATAAVVAVAVIAGIVIAVTRHGGPAGRTSLTTSTRPVVLRVASASAFAGGGGSADHPEEASLAVDGKPSTAWYTQHYASAQFGQLRSGSGLLLDLGRSATVKTVRVTLAVPGVAVQLKAGDATGSLLSAHPVAAAESTGAAWVVHPDTKARYWLLWFTKLAPSGGGYRAGVAEVAFTG